MTRLARFFGPLSARDYFILPALCLGTVLLLFVGTEFVTRLVWVQSEHNLCEEMAGDYRITPNCTTRTKIAESPWTTYHFNECGYRSDSPCGPKPPGSIRLAIIGSSVGMAYRVASEDTFYVKTAAALNQLCHVPVDVQNLSVLSAGPVAVYRQAKEALKLKPDAVVFLVVPADLERPLSSAALASLDQPAPPPKLSVAAPRKTLLERLKFNLFRSRAVLMAEHFLFLNQDAYIRISLRDGDKADFLRTPLTAAWRERYADLNEIIGNMTRQLSAARIPLIVMPLPSRAETALLSAPRVPANVDPFAFGREIEHIATSQGALPADVMRPYSQIHNAERLYLAVDGHVGPEGQTVIAEQLVAKLKDGVIPALSHCDDRRVARSEP